jgi:hypothetical protein
VRWLVLMLVGCSEEEGGGGCPAGELADSHYCGDDGVSCETLAELSQGCMGSHTEQPCALDGKTYTLVGGDDAADLYYEGQALVAVARIGEGSSEECPDAWFGADLSECEPTGEPVTVYCDFQGE